ncbi:cytochrome c oxidase subunit II [Laribacter hongkongensis]|uniref:cytochrome c oxidase subunit II n=1 Tax=Laribacter hongkongensis TaxID=168471 RepID=UPI001EFD2F10|nr:cytochrome c oxidase subunit II [Laribacter hongkongensis]MCG9031937.1 cytochrome c oxidase subunit II [Laribacter hongkongensis]MCG9092456.1 cytochrome c oxidase subunit II [Laribacter hongkongensis]
MHRLSAVPLSLLLLGSRPAMAEWQLNLQPPATELAGRIFNLHSLLLLICAGIFFGVLGVMFYAIFRHRKAAGHTARHFHENPWVEVLWTVIPFLILIGIAVPATRMVLAQKDASGAELTIKATGYQWKWGYEYVGEGVQFMSHLATPRAQVTGQEGKSAHYLLEVDEPLVVPVGQKVRLLLTANDVIHSWWVPALGVKQDAIPGFVRDAWFKIDRPGIYRGQCTELCGKDHGFMPIVVDARTPKDYAAWLTARKQAVADDPGKVWTMPELRARGEKVFQQNCMACHQADGRGIPGSFPALAGSRIATGDPAAHIEIVLYGSKKNPAMAAFGRQLSDTDIAAVITYERNAFGNQTGQMIEPARIAAARQGKG